MIADDDFPRELAATLPRLRRFAHALSRDAADADDLTQATVERALKARAQWQPGTQLTSWTYRIMRNLWIDTTRARARAARVELPPEAGEIAGYDPRAETETRLDANRAMRALSRLPDEQREVLALILVEGFGYREAAELLNVPIGTVTSRLVRGRKALLAIMTESERDD